MVNAFWLDRDLEQAARWLVNRHVTSTVFECSMVLTTAVQLVGSEEDDLYFTHENHPLTQWAAASLANWRYLRTFTEHAHDEWCYRWDHPDEIHGSWATALTVDESALPKLAWPETKRRDPPQVTDQWMADDYVDAYRRYYANEKRHLFSWAKDRTKPPWVDDYSCSEGSGEPE